MNIEFTQNPSSQDMDFLTQKINQESPKYGVAYSFAFLIRGNNSEIIAGCNGSVVFGAIYTDQIWVHPDQRKLGLGRKLMERVHSYGLEVGCATATVSTMSFQGAREFYEGLGYLSDFERSGYAGNSTCIFMKKSL